MSATTQKNFRLDEHYTGLLAWASELFGVSESELFRRLLDNLNYRYGVVAYDLLRSGAFDSAYRDELIARRGGKPKP